MKTSSLLSKLVSIATESTVMSETSYCVTLGCNSCCKQVKIKIKTYEKSQDSDKHYFKQSHCEFSLFRHKPQPESAHYTHKDNLLICLHVPDYLCKQFNAYGCDKLSLCSSLHIQTL